MGGQKRFFRITDEGLSHILLSDRTIEGLPDDTTINMHESYYDNDRMMWYILCESDEFEDVPEGAVIPQVDTDGDGYKTYEVAISNPDIEEAFTESE